MTSNKIVLQNAIASSIVADGVATASAVAEAVERPLGRSDASLSEEYGKLQAVTTGSEKSENIITKDVTEELQEEIKRILRQKASQDDKKNNGVLKCCTVPRSEKPHWWLSTRLDASCISLHNIWYEDYYCHCKSIWVCPRCAPMIAFGRRFQIRELIYTAKKEDDKECYLLTLTTRHDASMGLEDLLDKLGGALVRLWQDWTIKDIYGKKFVGRVTVCEIMYGFNGWHPHFHILLVGDKGLDVKELSSTFTEKWLAMLKKEGLEGLEGIACDFEACKDIKDYLTKIPCEICGVSKKDGKFPRHLNFFGLVSKCVQTPYGARKRKLESLIFEFYMATKHRKFIHFSKGLLARYGIKDEDEDAFMDRMQGLDKDYRRVGLGFAFDEGYENLNRDEVAWCLRVLTGYEKGKSSKDVHEFLERKGVVYHMEGAREADGFTGDRFKDAWIKDIRRRHKGKHKEHEGVVFRGRPSQGVVAESEDGKKQ